SAGARPSCASRGCRCAAQAGRAGGPGLPARDGPGPKRHPRSAATFDPWAESRTTRPSGLRRARATVRGFMEPLSRPTPARILLLLSVAELLGMSPWFAASAVAPQLAARWDLGAAQTAALTSSVQLGFVAGTAIAA